MIGAGWGIGACRVVRVYWGIGCDVSVAVVGGRLGVQVGEVGRRCRRGYKRRTEGAGVAIPQRYPQRLDKEKSHPPAMGRWLSPWGVSSGRVCLLLLASSEGCPIGSHSELILGRLCRRHC